MRISDWSSDVCSSDLGTGFGNFGYGADSVLSGFSDEAFREMSKTTVLFLKASTGGGLAVRIIGELGIFGIIALTALVVMLARMMRLTRKLCRQRPSLRYDSRSEEHTSELQSLMRISYAVFCLKKTTNITYVRL